MRDAGGREAPMLDARFRLTAEAPAAPTASARLPRRPAALTALTASAGRARSAGFGLRLRGPFHASAAVGFHRPRLSGGPLQRVLVLFLVVRVCSCGIYHSRRRALRQVGRGSAILGDTQGLPVPHGARPPAVEQLVLAEVAPRLEGAQAAHEAASRKATRRLRGLAGRHTTPCAARAGHGCSYGPILVRDHHDPL